jgi:hypothetical protein
MRFRCLGIALLIGVSSCAQAAPDFGKQVTYVFSTDYFNQITKDPALPDSCWDTLQMQGQLTFLVNEIGVTFVDARGKLDVNQTTPDSAPLDCKDRIPLLYRLDNLQANVTGPPSSVRFTVESSGVASGTTYTRRYTYKGSLNQDGGTGVLTYELDGTTLTGKKVTVNTNFGVTLIPVTNAHKVDPPGKG